MLTETESVLAGLLPWSVACDDAVRFLRTLPTDSVHSCISSPPYFNARNYCVDGQIGLESTPAEYVGKLVEVFGEARRVLRPDGCLALNLGDGYAVWWSSRRDKGRAGFGDQDRTRRPDSASSLARSGLKPKDKLCIPAITAIALREAGWWLRDEIIWAKGISFTKDRRPDVKKALLREAKRLGFEFPADVVERIVEKASPFVGNPMPSSVRDRTTSAHESVFILAKSPTYFWDGEVLKEADTGKPSYVGFERPQQISRDGRGGEAWQPGAGRSARSVWLIPPRSDRTNHYAIMSPDLVARLVAVTTSEKGCCAACGKQYERIVERKRVPTRPGVVSKVHAADGDSEVVGNRDPQRHVTTTKTVGWEAGCDCNAEVWPSLVLDPFAGSGTTIAEARKQGRRGIGCDLNPAYVKLAHTKIAAAEQSVEVAA